MTIKEINTNLLEGRLLMSALARLTVQVDTNKTPDECLSQVEDVSKHMYRDSPELQPVQEAMKTLCNALIEDPGYYQGWIDNLSLKFQDRILKEGQGVATKEFQASLRMSCNQAADDFLQTLIYERLKKFPAKHFIQHKGGRLEELKDGKLNRVQSPSMSKQMADSYGTKAQSPGFAKGGIDTYDPGSRTNRVHDCPVPPHTPEG